MGAIGGPTPLSNSGNADPGPGGFDLGKYIQPDGTISPEDQQMLIQAGILADPDALVPLGPTTPGSQKDKDKSVGKRRASEGDTVSSSGTSGASTADQDKFQKAYNKASAIVQKYENRSFDSLSGAEKRELSVALSTMANISAAGDVAAGVENASELAIKLPGYFLNGLSGKVIDAALINALLTDKPVLPAPRISSVSPAAINLVAENPFLSAGGLAMMRIASIDTQHINRETALVMGLASAELVTLYHDISKEIGDLTKKKYDLEAESDMMEAIGAGISMGITLVATGATVGVAMGGKLKAGGAGSSIKSADAPDAPTTNSLTGRPRSTKSANAAADADSVGTSSASTLTGAKRASFAEGTKGGPGNPGVDADAPTSQSSQHAGGSADAAMESQAKSAKTKNDRAAAEGAEAPNANKETFMGRAHVFNVAFAAAFVSIGQNAGTIVSKVAQSKIKIEQSRVERAIIQLQASLKIAGDARDTVNKEGLDALSANDGSRQLQNETSRAWVQNFSTLTPS